MSEPTPACVLQDQPFPPGPGPDHRPQPAAPTQGHNTADLAVKIDAAHRAAKTAIQNALANAVRCGELLIQAKSQVPHGEWLAWLERQTSVSERTAQAYMRLARKLKSADPQRVADMSVREALAAIATPKPEPKPQPRATAAPVAAEPNPSRRLPERRTLPDMVGREAIRRAESGREHSLAALKKDWRMADDEARRGFLEWLQESGEVMVLGSRLTLKPF